MESDRLQRRRDTSGKHTGQACVDTCLSRCPPRSSPSSLSHSSPYRRQKEKEQLAMLRKHHEEEIDHHRKEIERLQREIDRHKGKIRKLKHDD